MKNPCSSDTIRNDGCVDEINDWYHVTNEECKGICGNEPYLALPVIGYFDKTGIGVNQ